VDSMAFDPNPLLVGFVVLLGPVVFIGFAIRWVADVVFDGAADGRDSE